MESTATISAPIAARLPAAVVAVTAIYLLVATTTGFFWIDSWHDEQRAAQIVLLTMVAVATAWLQCAQSGARLAPAVLVVLGLGVVSSLLSGHASDALAEVSLTGLLCVLAVTVAQLVTGAGPAAVRAISRAALFIAMAHVVGAVTRYAAALEVGQSFGAEIWLLGFSNPRVASSFYALLIPLTALGTFATVEPDRRLRVVAWAALVALWTTAAGLEARALWLSYALAVPALLVLAWSAGTRRLVATLTIAAMAGVAIQFVLPLPAGPPGAVANAARDLTSLNSRDILWQLALEGTLQHPLFGLGPGQFARLGSFAGAHPHNWILQLATEWGMPALSAVLVGLFGLFRRLRSSPPGASPGEAVRTASALAVLVGLASGLVDGTLVMPTSQVEFALVFGLLVGTLSPPHVRRGVLSIPSNAGRRWIGALLIVAAAASLVVYGVSSYAMQEVERASFGTRFPGKWFVPRFWESGLTLAPTTTGSER